MVPALLARPMGTGEGTSEDSPGSTRVGEIKMLEGFCAAVYDLLISSTGVGSLGRTAQVWFDPSKLVVDSHVTIVRAADPRYALYMGFWAFEHERYIESLHAGSTGQTELSRDHVKAIRLALPSDEELEKFNAASQPVVELIVANQEESKRLAELRDTLLPKLMSSEIDVSSVAI